MKNSICRLKGWQDSDTLPWQLSPCPPDEENTRGEKWIEVSPNLCLQEMMKHGYYDVFSLAYIEGFINMVHYL